MECKESVFHKHIDIKGREIDGGRYSGHEKEIKVMRWTQVTGVL